MLITDENSYQSFDSLVVIKNIADDHNQAPEWALGHVLRRKSYFLIV